MVVSSRKNKRLSLFGEGRIQFIVVVRYDSAPLGKTRPAGCRSQVISIYVCASSLTNYRKKSNDSSGRLQWVKCCEPHDENLVTFDGDMWWGLSFGVPCNVRLMDSIADSHCVAGDFQGFNPSDPLNLYDIDRIWDICRTKDKVDQVPMSRHIPRGLTTSLPRTSTPHVTSLLASCPDMHVSIGILNLCQASPSITQGFFGSQLFNVRDHHHHHHHLWLSFVKQNWGSLYHYHHLCFRTCAIPMHARSRNFYQLRWIKLKLSSVDG